MISETTSRLFEWDHANRLATFRVQAGSAEPSIYAQYRYDTSGTRVVKLVRNQNGPNTVTIYVGGIFERILRTTKTGTTTTHDRLHVVDVTNRVATAGRGDPLPDDAMPPIVYHLADHLRSSTVVLDTSGAALNREEYTPYGETTFGSYARKRYRYTGKERDEESSLYYHGARYYTPWLARWISADPMPQPTHSLYRYGADNPLRVFDPSGAEDNLSMPPAAQPPPPDTNGTIIKAGPAEQPLSAPPQLKSKRTTEDLRQLAEKQYWQNHNALRPQQKAALAAEEASDIRASAQEKASWLGKLTFKAGEFLGFNDWARFGTGEDENANTLTWDDRIAYLTTGTGKVALNAITAYEGVTALARGGGEAALAGEGEALAHAGPSFRGQAGLKNAEDAAYSAFSKGIPARGGPNAAKTTENLLKSINETSAQADSAFVQSSQSHGVAMHYATSGGQRGGSVFNIVPSADSLVVNESPLAPAVRFPEQQIVAHPGGIRPNQIESVDLVDKKGNWIVSYFNIAIW